MRSGYTLIETIIVISIIGIISTLAFFGIYSTRSVQNLSNAQNELLSNLRSTQNKALSGSNIGQTYTFLMDIPNKSYIISTNGSTVNYKWPEGVAMDNPGPICFFNPNIALSPTPRCNGPTAYDYGADRTITITGSAGTRVIRISGQGYFVTRIYAP